MARKRTAAEFDARFQSRMNAFRPEEPMKYTEYALYSYHNPDQPCGWCIPAVATHQVTDANSNIVVGYICDACIPRLNTPTSTVVNPI